MNINLAGFTVITIALIASAVNAQEYTVERSKVFAPQGKKVLLLKETSSAGGGAAGGPEARKIILFQTNLRVNTDGAPLSYHTQDPRGRTLAINTVCNGFAVRRVGSRDNL